MYLVKNIRHLKISIPVLLLGIVFSGGFHVTEGLEKPIPVFVSIAPQVTFVRRIGGDRVTVEALVLPGESPATYSPKPSQIAKLAKSKLFYRIGVPFEDALMKRIERTAKQVQIIDTRKGITLRKMDAHVDVRPESHEHGGSHEHGNDGYDPHIWLNPLLVKKQAETIRDGLTSLDPQGRKEYETNYVTFLKDLDVLDKKIRHALAPVKGETIFVFHPSYGYFADAYGLRQLAVETGGKAPKGKDLSQFIKLAKKEKVRVIFVQPQFDRTAAAKIARAINGAVIPLDPLSGAYFKNMEKMAETIHSALKN